MLSVALYIVALLAIAAILFAAHPALPVVWLLAAAGYIGYTVLAAHS